MIYSTTYGRNALGSYLNKIEAPTEAAATRILMRRHLGEHLTWGDYGVPLGAYTEPLAPRSSRIQTAMNGKALHQACFLAYVGLKAGVLTLEETVGDDGLLHQLTHDCHFGPDSTIPPRETLARMYDEQRRRVPGWPHF